MPSSSLADADDRWPWPRMLKAALLSFLIWRCSLFVFDFIGLNLTPRMGACRKQWEVFGPDHYFLNGFFRWDSGWYRTIVLKGYTFHADKPSSVAFYPLYPYLCRALGSLLGSPFAAGLVISNAATVGALFYLRRLGALLYGERVAQLAVVLLLVFPSSLFLAAFYTEGLFLCLSSAAMFYYFRGRFLLCGACGFLAMLTRSTGLVLFLALALDLAWQLLRRQERFRWAMLGLLLIPAGLGCFMGLLAYQVGDSLAFAKTVEHWGRENSLPWDTLLNVFQSADYGFKRDAKNVQDLIDATLGCAFLAIGVLMALRGMRVALWAFVLIGVLLPLSTTNIAGLNRYVLSLFPAFLFVASVCQRRPQLERYVIFASSLFLALYSLRFMQCGWAG
jgi:hypothetical protein